MRTCVRFRVSLCHLLSALSQICVFRVRLSLALFAGLKFFYFGLAQIAHLAGLAHEGIFYFRAARPSGH